ncbi:NAD(P)H-dependent flavin oxidoreductase [Ottowia pentelensis]|uniref:Propionate 3-nitronate monooxygenase n=1 Tax=Ottowia pentelensis TaxID=511108 RepID=A0ABV6PSK2_9BURK
MSSSSLQDRLGLRWPLLQAPMAGAQASALALAVSGAGALGALPCALLAPDALRRELAVMAASGRPYNVNWFCHAPPVPDAAREAVWRAALKPYFDELGLDVDAVPAGPGRAPFSAEAAETMAEFKPPVLSFHYGLPAPALLARVKSWGAFVLSSATTVPEALWLEEHGADAIIAQGLEAGGHRGHFLSDDLSEQMGTFALLPQVVQAVKLPVIAAGGIASADGVRAARALGAAGVQVGTAYLCADEALTTPAHRAALQSEAARHTVITNLVTGRPARGIVNRVMRELGPMSDAPSAFPLATAAMAYLRAQAEKQGRLDFTHFWSGQNASGCRAAPAADITRALAAGWD